MQRVPYTVWGGILLAAALAGGWTLQGPEDAAAQEPDFEEDSGLVADVPEEEQPIAVELAQGIDLLNEQITTQQALLKNAQTERERQLIQNHIRSLQKERRSLESLLHKLVGPNVDVLESVREHQAEERSERSEKILEQDQRFPSQ